MAFSLRFKEALSKPSLTLAGALGFDKSGSSSLTSKHIGCGTLIPRRLVAGLFYFTLLFFILFYFILNPALFWKGWE